MFSVTIEQSILAKALEFLEPTVGRNASQFGDNCISMMTTGNGSMRMYTTNTVEYTTIEVIVGIGGNTTDQAPYVDFKRFKGIIASIPANEMVSISQTNSSDLQINYAMKGTPVTLVGSNNGMLPIPPNAFSNTPTVTIPKAMLTKALNSATSIITDSSSAPIYNCVHISTNGMVVDFTAVDTAAKRTFMYTGVATQNNPQADILVEASKLKKSLKIFDDYQDLDMYMDTTMVRIDGAVMVANASKTNGMISSVSYNTRRLSGVFPPNIKNNFNPPPQEFCEINKAEMLATFARVKSLEDSSTGGQIGFEVNGSNCMITMNSSYGRVEDSIIMENVSTKSFKTVFKHQNISDIIKTLPTDTFEIGVLPAHPTNYVVRAKGSADMMFTIPALVGGNNP